MVKTFKELQEVDALMGELYRANPELKNTRFGYAYKRFADKNYTPLIKEFQHEINDARIDQALEDPVTKEIKTDPVSPRGFKYSKEGLKQVIKLEHTIIEKWDNKEVEIVPHICQKESLPELNEEQMEILVGILIQEENDK